jgi:hypothetical protein
MIAVAKSADTSERDAAEDLRSAMIDWNENLSLDDRNEIWIIPSVNLRWEDGGRVKQREIDLLVLGALCGKKRLHVRDGGNRGAWFDSLCLTVEVKNISMKESDANDVIIERRDGSRKNATSQARKHLYAVKDYLVQNGGFAKQTAFPPPFVSGALWMRRDHAGRLPDFLTVGKNQGWAGFLNRVRDGTQDMRETGHGPFEDPNLRVTDSGVKDRIWRYGSNKGGSRDADSVRLAAEDLFDVHFSHYNWLELGRDADKAAVQKARRKRLRDVHPDRAADDVDEHMRNALSKRINTAATTLLKNRRRYDGRLEKDRQKREAERKRWKERAARRGGNETSSTRSRRGRSGGKTSDGQGERRRGASGWSSGHSGSGKTGKRRADRSGAGQKGRTRGSSRQEPDEKSGTSRRSPNLDAYFSDWPSRTGESESGRSLFSSKSSFLEGVRRGFGRIKEAVLFPFYFLGRAFRWIEWVAETILTAFVTAVRWTTRGISRVFWWTVKVGAALVIVCVSVATVHALTPVDIFSMFESTPRQIAIVEVTAANVRTGPSTDSRVIGVARKGDTLRVREGDGEGWTPVRYDGEKGFVFSKLILRQSVPSSQD